MKQLKLLIIFSILLLIQVQTIGFHDIVHDKQQQEQNNLVIDQQNTGITTLVLGNGQKVNIYLKKGFNLNDLIQIQYYDIEGNELGQPTTYIPSGETTFLGYDACITHLENRVFIVVGYQYQNNSFLKGFFVELQENTEDNLFLAVILEDSNNSLDFTPDQAQFLSQWSIDINTDYGYYPKCQYDITSQKIYVMYILKANKPNNTFDYRTINLYVQSKDVNLQGYLNTDYNIGILDFQIGRIDSIDLAVSSESSLQQQYHYTLISAVVNYRDANWVDGDQELYKRILLLYQYNIGTNEQVPVKIREVLNQTNILQNDYAEMKFFELQQTAEDDNTIVTNQYLSVIYKSSIDSDVDTQIKINTYTVGSIQNPIYQVALPQEDAFEVPQNDIWYLYFPHFTISNGIAYIVYIQTDVPMNDKQYATSKFTYYGVEIDLLKSQIVTNSQKLIHKVESESSYPLDLSISHNYNIQAKGYLSLAFTYYESINKDSYFIQQSYNLNVQQESCVYYKWDIQQCYTCVELQANADLSTQYTQYCGATPPPTGDDDSSEQVGETQKSSEDETDMTTYYLFIALIVLIVIVIIIFCIIRAFRKPPTVKLTDEEIKQKEREKQFELQQKQQLEQEKQEKYQEEENIEIVQVQPKPQLKSQRAVPSETNSQKKPNKYKKDQSFNSQNVSKVKSQDWQEEEYVNGHQDSIKNLDEIHIMEPGSKKQEQTLKKSSIRYYSEQSPKNQKKSPQKLRAFLNKSPNYNDSGKRYQQTQQLSPQNQYDTDQNLNQQQFNEYGQELQYTQKYNPRIDENLRYIQKPYMSKNTFQNYQQQQIPSNGVRPYSSYQKNETNRKEPYEKSYLMNQALANDNYNPYKVKPQNKNNILYRSHVSYRSNYDQGNNKLKFDRNKYLDERKDNDIFYSRVQTNSNSNINYKSNVGPQPVFRPPLDINPYSQTPITHKDLQNSRIQQNQPQEQLILSRLNQNNNNIVQQQVINPPSQKVNNQQQFIPPFSVVNIPVTHNQSQNINEFNPRDNPYYNQNYSHSQVVVQKPYQPQLQEQNINASPNLKNNRYLYQ